MEREVVLLKLWLRREGEVEADLSMGGEDLRQWMRMNS